MKNKLENLANKTLHRYGFHNWRTIAMFRLLEILN